MAHLLSSDLDCVVAVFVRDKDMRKIQVASGFLFGNFVGTNTDGKPQYTLYFVTNRHVLNEKTTIGLRFNSLEGEFSKEYDIKLVNEWGKPMWFGHPNDAIDIAIIPINPNKLDEDKVRFNFFPSNERVMTRKKGVELGLTEGDEIFLMGFPLPNIIDDAMENYVIVRKGAISRIRDCLSKKRDTFFVDVANFPGNSGGPIVNKPELSGITGTKIITNSYLIGIVSAYLPFSDVAISQQTGRHRVIFEENSNLALVYPTDYILEIIESSLNGQNEINKISPSPTRP